MTSTPPAADPTREYLVLGAGAIGGTLAYHLAAAGHPVTIVDTDEEHVRAIRQDGIAIMRGDAVAGRARMERAVTPAQVAQGDLTARRVLLATKAQHTEEAIGWLAPYLAADGFVVSCQNGENEPVIAAILGDDRVVGAFVNIFADVVGPGAIRDGGPGAFVIGETSGAISRRVLETTADLTSWGPVRASDNVQGYQWAKHAFGEMLSATALVDAPMAETIDRHRGVVTAVAREVNRVAVAEGQRLEPFDGYQPHAFTDDATPAATDTALDHLVGWLSGMPKDRSGVWRDIAVRHRRTEAHLDLRRLIQLAGRHGLATPLLERLDHMLTELEDGQRAFGDDNLRELGRAA